MTDYVKSTNFASKDSLPLGNPLKIVKGTEIDTEFNNIATAVGTKVDKIDTLATANSVPYYNGSKVLTTGSALQFDGSNLGLGVAPSAWQSGLTSLDLKSEGFISGGGSYIALLSNTYFNSGARYKTTGFNATQYLQQSGAHIWSTASPGTAGNAISFTQAMTLDASGNLGVGTTNPLTKLHLQDNSAVFIQLTDSGEGASRIGQNGTALTFGVDLANGTTERARIDSSGNLLVGTTVSAGQGGMSVRVGGFTPNVLFNRVNTTSASYPLEFQNAGSIVGYVVYDNTSASLVSVSDHRLKEDIQPMTGALGRNAQLNPVIYKWKADGSEGEGFIAHQLQEVFPKAVTSEKDAVDEEGKPVYQCIGTGPLDGHFAACVNELAALIQEQQAIINAQGTALNQLNAQLTSISEDMAALKASQ